MKNENMLFNSAGSNDNIHPARVKMKKVFYNQT